MSFNKSSAKKDKIKLLFLLPSFTFGGAERTSVNLLSEINKDLFRINLATSKSVYKYFEHLNLDEFISIEHLGIDVWFSNCRKFIKDVKKIATLLKKQKPDIALGMMHYPSALLVFARRLYNLPVKIIVSPRGPSKEFMKYFVDKLTTKLFLQGVFTFFLKYADGIVVASTGMKEECIRHYSASHDKIAVIPNSVDIEAIAAKSTETIDIDLPQNAFLLCAVSRLEKEKNLPFLLAAFSEVIQKEKAKLLIIGDGSQRNFLESLSYKLGINTHVIFTGYQENPYKFIKQSDIFIHTCLFEGFANVIIEAMSCGVAVISIDCPYGPRDIISNGENGILVEMNNEKALSYAILKLMQDDVLRHKIAKKGLISSERFSRKVMAEGYERFFFKIADYLS